MNVLKYVSQWDDRPMIQTGHNIYLVSSFSKLLKNDIQFHVNGLCSTGLRFQTPVKNHIAATSGKCKANLINTHIWLLPQYQANCHFSMFFVCWTMNSRVWRSTVGSPDQFWENPCGNNIVSEQRFYIWCFWGYFVHCHKSFKTVLWFP